MFISIKKIIGNFYLGLFFVFFIYIATNNVLANEQIKTLKTTDYNNIFIQANLEYKNGNLNKALELYESLEQQDIKSSALYYNLASIYLNKAEKFKALAYFLKSKNLSPNDLNTHRQINSLQKEVNLELSETKNIFITNNYLTLEQVILISLVLWVLLWSFIFLLKNKSKTSKKDILIISLIILNIVSILSVSDKIFTTFNKKAMVVTKKSDIKTSFDNSAIVLGSISEGTILNILDKNNDSYKIETQDGLLGWVKASSIVCL
ncbi:MAG: hypothetical protein U0457_06805 [Candidatus Sericytochromatia bacterium]